MIRAIARDVDALGGAEDSARDVLSAARIYAEMSKALLTAQEPDIFFRVLRDADALMPWFAELSALCGVQQNPVHHPEGDAFEHTMRTLRAAAEVKDRSSHPLHFMLAALTHDLGKAVSARQDEQGNWHAAGHAETGVPLCGAMLTRLGAPKAAIRYAQNMCRLHMRVHVCYYTKADEAQVNLLFDESVCAQDLALLAVCDTRGTGKPRENADREEAFVMDALAAYARAAAGVPDAGMLMAAERLSF